MKWFWENYKPEEYSLWKATYKYPEELSKQGELPPVFSEVWSKARRLD